MSSLNTLFRKRIGVEDNEKVSFENLDNVMTKAALTIPFENRRIIRNDVQPISKKYLTNNLLVNEEGGVCYELNALLYLFLIENDFNVSLTTGVVFKNEHETYETLGKSHVSILMTHEDQTYIVDTGFGTNLPLSSVPLDGNPIRTLNGDFRIKEIASDNGDYLFEQKLKYKDTDWRPGYVFDSRKSTHDFSTLNAIQDVINEHPDSPFNKHYLLAKLTTKGSISLTDTTFTQWKHGVKRKEEIDRITFESLMQKHFGIATS